MKTKRLLNSLAAVGALIILIALSWWGGVYYFVSNMNGESMWSSFHCLYSMSADCNLLRSMTWLQGMNGYEPMLFWLGLTLLLSSLLVRSSLLKELDSNTGRQM